MRILLSIVCASTIWTIYAFDPSMLEHGEQAVSTDSTSMLAAVREEIDPEYVPLEWGDLSQRIAAAQRARDAYRVYQGVVRPWIGRRPQETYALHAAEVFIEHALQKYVIFTDPMNMLAAVRKDIDPEYVPFEWGLSQRIAAAQRARDAYRVYQGIVRPWIGRHPQETYALHAAEVFIEHALQKRAVMESDTSRSLLTRWGVKVYKCITKWSMWPFKLLNLL